MVLRLGLVFNVRDTVVALHCHCVEMVGKTLQYQRMMEQIAIFVQHDSDPLTLPIVNAVTAHPYRNAALCWEVISLSQGLRPCMMNTGSIGSGWRTVSNHAVENLVKSSVDRRATVL